MTIGIDEKEEVCANCKHFIQHYIRWAWGSYAPCNAGHCTYPRIKNRKPGQTCDHFESTDQKGERSQILLLPYAGEAS